MGTMPQNDGEHITMPGARGLQAIQAGMSVDGATEAEVFRAYVTRVLGPTRAPEDSVGLDNLSAHKATGVQQAPVRRRMQRLFWPPYSPDWSPMELCLSQLKTAWRAAKASRREALETAVQKAMETVTAIAARNWFRHCGYALWRY